MKDLLMAGEHIAAGTESASLRQFVWQGSRSDRIDLLTNPEALELAVRPSSFPAGKWPAPGRHPLVLMQQAAVNLAVKELKADEAVFAVNGPPGTGKTTLLRDICAALVVERAARLVEFDDPAKAFARTGVSLSAGGSKVELLKLDERIRGFEIVVASMNNRAVENISRELPGIDAIAADAQQLRYFNSVSDHLSGEGSTWGLISAVLGNQKNMSEFWFKGMKDEDRGLLAYLAAAAGVKTVVGQHGVGETGPRPPEVVVREKPPSGRAEALQRWQAARLAFRRAMDAANTVIQDLEKLRARCVQLEAFRTDLKEKIAVREECRTRLEIETAKRKEAQYEAERISAELSDSEGDMVAHQAIRPAWWRRLLLLADARAWAARRRELRDRMYALRKAARVADDECVGLERSRIDCLSKHAAAAKEADLAESRYGEADSAVKSIVVSTAASPVFASEIAEAVGDQDRAAIHKMAPWFGSDARLSRDSVFIAAMNLHRAFIDVAADQIRGNIAALFGMAKLSTKERLPLVPHLWATLFLVIPVASTTFASVARRFEMLPPNSFGWLLIDEAGQAPPQAAVGALMRSQRAVIVGDPLQIEPVVSLPHQLVEAICQYYGIEADRWVAPNASVQTLADAVCKFSSSIKQVTGSRDVGLALIVHRRCQSPMFEISNYVAYGGQMIQGTPAAKSASLLGSSRWIDVAGTSVSKWSEAEGDVLIQLLTQFVDGHPGKIPDVFVISPFRNVANKLKTLIPAKFSRNVERGWWAERVGTIHTFQGKQASIVFLVLGASDPREEGARRWAAGTPNIVNVAASRAKDYFYVVGSAVAWQSIGSMRIVRSYLRTGQ